MKKWIIRIFIIFLLALVAAFIFYVYPKLPIINAYAAKRACSSIFVSGRTLESVQEQELKEFPQSLPSLDVIISKGIVEAKSFGLSKVTSVYRQGLGCKVVIDIDDTVQSPIDKDAPILSSTDTLYWPYGMKEYADKAEGIDYDKLDEAIELAFDEERQWEKKTRALLIMHKGQLLSEKYLSPYNRETPFLGWSMTKSVENILVGILVKEGKLDIQKSKLFARWQNDERKNIKLDNLLRMNSGLSWNEEYGSISQVTEMLFLEESTGDYAIQSPYLSPPGEVWNYSSGSSNIINQLIKESFESEEDYLLFPYEKLFHKLDIKSAQLETDERGDYVMSSFMYATARDWAKLGQLMLNNGVWLQDTIITNDWVEYSFSETAHSEGRYGAHMWRNGNPKEYSSCPDDTYKFSGYEGQYVIMIPSLDLVVVRLGLSKGPPFNMDGVMGLIVESVVK